VGGYDVFMSRRDALILRAASLWTLWVWGTRIANILGDENRSAAFKAVHVALAAVSVAFAVAIWLVAAKNRRRTDISS
jgi:hypothetical protein